MNRPVGKDQAEVLPLAATIVNLSDGRQQLCGAAIGTGEAERDTASLWGRPAFRLPPRRKRWGRGLFPFPTEPGFLTAARARPFRGGRSIGVKLHGKDGPSMAFSQVFGPI